jgi:hypothetical protein
MMGPYVVPILHGQMHDIVTHVNAFPTVTHVVCHRVREQSPSELEGCLHYCPHLPLSCPLPSLPFLTAERVKHARAQQIF